MPSLITRGVSTSSHKKLIELVSVNAQRQKTSDEKAALELGANIDAAQKNFREAFWREINKLPDGQTIRQKSDDATNAFKSLVSKKPDKSTLEKGITTVREALDGIEKSYRSTISSAVKRAVDQDKYSTALLKAIKRKPNKLKKGPYGGFVMNFDPSWTIIKNLRFPPTTSFTLEQPFDPDANVTEVSSALAGVTFADSSVDGSVSGSSTAVFAGYQMARGQVGAFLTIPSGFSTLTLQARIVSVRSDLSAFALGASWASSGGIAEVTSTANSSVTRRETSIRYVVAPLLFYAHDLFNGPHVINAEFPIPSDGGEILVTAGLKCDTWAAVAAGSLAFLSGTVSKITVKVS